MIRSSNHTCASWRQLSTHHARHCLLTSPKCDAYVFDLLLACNFHRHGSPISCSCTFPGYLLPLPLLFPILSSPTEEVPVTTSPCSWSSIRFGQRQWGYSPVSPRQNYPSEFVSIFERGWVHPTHFAPNWFIRSHYGSRRPDSRWQCTTPVASSLWATLLLRELWYYSWRKSLDDTHAEDIISEREHVYHRRWASLFPCV